MLFSAVPYVRSQQVELVENGRRFTVAAFTVGNSSDLFVEFRCLGAQPVASWTRAFRDGLPQPLDPRTTSYDPSSGVVRIFSKNPANMMLRCFRDGPGFGVVELSPGIELSLHLFTHFHCYQH